MGFCFFVFFSISHRLSIVEHRPSSSLSTGRVGGWVGGHSILNDASTNFGFGVISLSAQPSKDTQFKG